MSKINKNSINFGLRILSILAFSLLFIPFNITKAEGGENYVYNENFNLFGSENIEKSNPRPSISFISPSSAEKGSGSKTVTITGGGFVPGSVAKVNGSNRTTTFIDHSHILVNITSNDISQNGGFFISVYNPSPDGGYSNAIRFSIKEKAVTTVNSTSKQNTSSSYENNRTDETSYESSQYEEDNYNSLASNAIFGSGSFLPSGIIQWILFAILILIIVILARKIFGAKEDYDEAPMKHA
jgi:hypothetical protein